MVIVRNEDLNIEKIAASGQCFRINKVGEHTWQNIAYGKVLIIEERLDGSAAFHCSKKEFASIWSPYFDLESDYSLYRGKIPRRDKYMRSAADFGKGIRILKQDPWEILITFIISQRKNIPAIKASVEALSKMFGEPLGNGLYAFPTAKQLMQATEVQLKDCSLGYRVPYIMDAAKKVAMGEINLAQYEDFSDAALMEALLSMKGVGIKVANCIALFAYHRINSFPIDVWIQRVLDEEYKGGEAFPFKRYKGFVGVMQQYMFFYARKKE